MDKTQQFQKAFEYAKSNPDSQYATELRRRITEGQYTNEVKALGLRIPGINNESAPAGPAPITPEPQQPGLLQAIGGDLKQRGQNIAEAQRQSVAGEQNPLSSGLQMAGNVAGGVGDIVGEVITRVPIVGDLLKKAGAAAVDNDTAQEILGKWESFSQQNPEAAKNLEATFNLASLIPIGGGASAAKSAATSATKSTVKAAKGAVGTVTKKTAQMAEKRAASKAFEAITPNMSELTQEEYKQLLRQKKIAPKTATGEAKYIPSKEELATAEKNSHLLQGSPEESVRNISDELARKDLEVEGFLKENNGIYNTGELKNFIKKRIEGVGDVTVSDSKLKKLKDGMIKEFTAKLERNDIESLWRARKEFDQSIEKAFSGSPTLQNTVKKEFRNAVQDFIAERTPNMTYKGYMKEMRNLFDLEDVLLTRAGKSRSLSGIGEFVKKNPNVIRAAIVGATAVGGKTAFDLIKN